MLLEAFDALVNLLYGNTSYDFSKYGCTPSQDSIEAEITVALNWTLLACWGLIY